jgi:hypothetical protein
MLFDAPITFEDALAARKVKALLPTELSSGELHQIAPELLERGTFMARNTHAGSLQTASDLIGNLLTPHTETRDGKPFTAGLDPASARLAMKKYLGEQGYVPQGEDEGTIKDFSSDARINLVLKMGVESAQGYGNWKQGQDEDVLDAFPAQELFRAEEREVPRDWIDRWQEAGGQVLEGERMIGLKNDPIWEEISAFGTPYPPFDYNSGMWIRDISREEAMDLGLIDQDTQIKPQDRGFNDELSLTPDIRSGALVTALEDAGYNFLKGVLSL